MSTKNVKGVIIPRHDTAKNWANAKNFIPRKGELIVYDADTDSYDTTVEINGQSYPVKSSTKVRFKFGDGIVQADGTVTGTNVNALPFQTDAIQGTTSGSVIQIDDISPVTHEMSVKISSDTITDFSSVNISRYGKNLFDATLILKKYTYEGITVESEADGFKFYGTATHSIYIGIVAAPDKFIPIPEHWKNKDLTIYCYGNTTALEIGFYDDNGNLNNFGTRVKDHPDSIIQVNTTGYTKFWFRLRFTAGVTYDDFVRIMVCEGLSSTATPYEPYVEPTEYTPNADGTVNGVTSLYPNTTLITDTEDVIIDCEYLTNNYKPVLDNRIPKQTQSDWQQNDETANDYVKNRPGGYDRLTEILPETTLNFAYNVLTLTNCPPIEVGKKYIVTFDNTEYELIGKNPSMEGIDNIYIGNESYTWGSTDTGEPFIIYNMSSNIPIIHIGSSTTLPCTYNIKIKAIMPIKIDEKYLDIKTITTDEIDSICV